MAKQAGKHAPWMIRNFEIAARERYVAQAARQQESTAGWVRAACEERYQRENNAVIIAPDNRSLPPPEGADRKPDQALNGALIAGGVSFQDMAAAAQSLAALKAAGGPVSDAAVRDAATTIRLAFRAMRGLGAPGRSRGDKQGDKRLSESDKQSGALMRAAPAPNPARSPS